MAKAQINTMTIETPVQVTVTEIKKEEKQTGVRLDLSMAEAETLRVLVGAARGNTHTSPTKYLYRIYTALESAGVAYEPEHYILNKDHNIRFEDYPDTKKATPEPVNSLKGEPEVGAGFTGCTGLKAYEPEAEGHPEGAPKVGDRVRITRVIGYPVYAVGDIGVVRTEKDKDGQWMADFSVVEGQKQTGSGWWNIGPESGAFEVIPPVAPAEPQKVAVGDTIKFLTNYAGVAYAGERMKVSKSDFGTIEGTLPPKLKHKHQFCRSIWVSATKEGIVFKRIAPEPLPSIFRVGDMVRVISDRLWAIDAGDIAKVTRIAMGGMYLETTCGSKKKGFASADQLVHV